MEPEWFPEYSIDLGSYTGSIPANTNALYHASWQVYRRNYENGIVLVNPSSSTRNINLGATYYRAVPQGGGYIPSDGQIPPAWVVTYTAVTSVSLPPISAAILMNQ
ncbi:MAG: hypothetical protein A2Y62_18170 [Candidatus Fischerbacteria bacterium RBG_13_37_8]|uniref:Uncharacterized protein n=1 Tax=Candidatus Fischerbacteria bacterium RBG_13_37_8 TaxID=1817863 RepID=A0A1F5VVJ2_9BACT|nr:MAG: hypothetical protein A2Y62_18170 [Candidatus Fischerbacteria bacterium RBG_13_37_8]